MVVEVVVVIAVVVVMVVVEVVVVVAVVVVEVVIVLALVISFKSLRCWNGLDTSVKNDCIGEESCDHISCKKG